MYKSHHYQQKNFKNICVTPTGMLDFDKLTGVSLKSQVMKAPAKRKFCRNYKNLDEDNFNKDLKLKLDSLQKLGYFFLRIPSSMI